MAGDRTNDARIPTPRYRNVSGKPLNRRVVLKAAAGLSAMAAAGGALTVVTPPVERVSAQEIDGVRGREWVASEQVGVAAQADGDGWVTFEAEFPFWAVGVGWDSAVGQWPVIEVEVSYDGVSWGETWPLVARVDDGGAETTVDKLFTDLLFTDGQQFIRYRTLDGEGNLSPVDGLVITYIDPTDGPWEDDRASTMMRTSATVANEDTDAPPTIITRAQWGANESLRFDTYGEIWPPEYETVQHAIVHHAAVNYPSGGYNAVRSIYYYHCVTQGWGDIGYNYLIDTEGRIFEGRVGGQNVIGGHSFEYAIGSSGICIMGDYRFQDATDASKAALVHILAFVTRDLDTYARKQFHEITNLPTICAHRDVNQTSCPGDYLYDDLPEIRDLVAATLDANDLDTGKPAGIVPGDQVLVQTDDGAPLNMRSAAGSSTVIGSIPDGTLLTIKEGPTISPSGNWYMVTHGGKTGWVTAEFLILSPPPPPADPGDYLFGTNMRFTSSTNVRNKPGTSAAVIGTATRNTWTFIMAGPIEANSYDWYQVRVPNIGDGWTIGENLAVAPVNENPTAKFKVGDTLRTSTSTSVRARPGAAQTVAATIAAGTTVKVTVAPIETTGYIWYGVSGSGFGGGWVTEQSLEAPAATKFAVGDSVRVTEALNMRSSASTSGGLIATLPVGTTGKVVAGPRTGSGYTWYQIQTSYGTGWVVENWVAKYTAPAPAPAKFAIGDAIRITDTMNRRSSPGTGSNVIGQFTAGATGKVLEGPRDASGYTWWRMETTSGTGWGAQNWVEKTSSAPPPSEEPTPPPATGRFVNGDTVRVTEPLNMRTSASTGAGIIATLPVGTTATVVGGPTTASGYTWWRIQASAGTGWVAENWLTKVSSAPPPSEEPTPPPSEEPTPPPTTGKFTAGQSVRVTEALNMRSSASTGGSLIATLPAGTTGTVVEGPRTGSGYTWWRIQTSYGTGWVAENWVAATSTSTGFRAGDSFRVTETLNMRSGAGTGNSIVATLPAGTTGTITASSRSANGYTWWPVRTSYGSGWVAQDWIVKT
jgi:uncharacterized protein YgiM (DUF1202 family)